jgi:hypothetical protein
MVPCGRADPAHQRRPHKGNLGAALSDELVEFLDGDLGRADDASKGTPVDLVMEGHRDGWTLGTHEPDVAAFLAKDGVAELGQGSDARSSGNDGKRWHAQAAMTLMSTTSYS